MNPARNPSPEFVALLGPPGAGKSTLSAALSRGRSARVFRMREIARSYRDLVPGLADAARGSGDPLGWIDDRFVAPLLQESIPRILALRPEVVLFENFPGNAHQVTALHAFLATLPQPSPRLRAVELTAPADLLRSRVLARRVCIVCEPDPDGDPHTPAGGSPGEPERCDRCGSLLRRRPSDELERFEARLSRYTCNRPALVDRLLAHDVKVHEVSGAEPRESIIETVGALLT